MYETLTKLFYKLNTDQFHDEYIKRTTSYASYCTNLTIKGFKKSEKQKMNFSCFI